MSSGHCSGFQSPPNRKWSNIGFIANILLVRQKRKAWDTNASYIPLILLVIAAVVVALFAEYAAPLQARFANTTGRLFSLSAMFPWRAFPCSLVLVVIDVLAAGLSYFVPLIRVLAILFGIAWVAYAKSLILLWGFKRYGGTGKVENPQYVNAHE